jgi:hypothetical protein
MFIAIVLYMIAMPGKSFSGALTPLTVEEIQIKTNLTRHVYYLSQEIGERNVIAYEPLQKTAQYIEDNFKKVGFQVKSQECPCPPQCRRHRGPGSIFWPAADIPCCSLLRS